MATRVPGGYNPAAVAITGGNTWFVPTGGSSGVAVSAPADATEDILATIPIPALTAASQIRVNLATTQTNSANNKTWKIKIGSTAMYTFNAVNSVTWQPFVLIQNRTTGSQIINPAGAGNTGLGNGTVAYTATAVDTSVATTMTITVQKQTAGETATLESFLVEVLKP